MSKWVRVGDGVGIRRIRSSGSLLRVLSFFDYRFAADPSAVQPACPSAEIAVGNQ